MRAMSAVLTLHTVLQVENILQVKKLLSCPCNEIRVGAEFCENKIPPLPDIISGLEMIKKAGKKASVIYPRLSNRKMAEVNDHLEQINRHFDSIQVVANDLGIVNRIQKEKLTHLNFLLGRQLISLPGRARPPMSQIMGKENLLSKFTDKQLFNKSNFNYSLTLEFLKQNGIAGFEIDFIPQAFPQLDIFTRANLEIYIHFPSVLISLTRKCHTARYFKKNSHSCGQLCFHNLLQISDNRVGILYLYGNTLLDFPIIHLNGEGFNRLKINRKSKDKYKMVIDFNGLSPLTQEKIAKASDFFNFFNEDFP